MLFMNDKNIITSRSNPLIMRIAKLADKKHRDSEQLFTFEGHKLLEEALKNNVEIEYIFHTENCDFFDNKLLNCRKFVVSDSVYSKISNEKSPQGIFCAAKYIDIFHKKVKIYNDNFKGRAFIIASVRDPGNLGTIIRSAAAFGIDQLILSSDCADIYNIKTVRASMGSLFRQRITIADDIVQTAEYLQNNGYTVYAAALDNKAVNLRDIEINDKVCFSVGNEGHGLPDEYIKVCGGTVIIPMTAGIESLNAAVAASILMWEAYR